MTEESNDKVEIIIVEEEPVSFTPESPAPAGDRVRAAAGNLGKKASAAAVSASKKAWQSQARKKVTGSLGKGASAARDRTQAMISEAVNARFDAEKERVMTNLRETDWKTKARGGAVVALQRLSSALGQLSQRLAQPRQKEPPPDPGSDS